MEEAEKNEGKTVTLDEFLQESKIDAKTL